ncbi:MULTISPECIES: ABC transporter permease [unclassified Blastococcus]
MVPRRVLAGLKALVGLALVAALWQYWAGVVHPDSIALPPPTDIVDYAVENPDVLLEGAAATLRVVGMGFLIAMLAAVALAVVFTLVPLLRDMFLPLLVVTQVTPVVAVAPLLVIWLGFGDAPKVAIVILVSFFPILVNTLAGIGSVQREVSELARGIGAARWRTVRYISLPSAIPHFLAGARVSIALAVIGAVVAEFVASDAGLGFVILRGSAQLQPEMMWAGVLGLAVIGLALFNLVRVVEYVITPWNRA